MTNESSTCSVCGEPMQPGEEMFKIHGSLGPCPKPPLPKMDRPSGSNADEWALFISDYGGASEFLAVQVSLAIEAEREACAEIAEAIDSNRGNEAEIARAIRDR